MPARRSKNAQKTAFRMRDPKSFEAAAEATMGDSLERMRALEQARAAEKERRDTAPGRDMPDGSVCAGVSPANGMPLLVLPQDANGLLTKKEAKKFIRDLNRQKPHGHADWRLPFPFELKQLWENRDAGGLRGTFNTAGAYPSYFYRSAESGLFSRIEGFNFHHGIFIVNDAYDTEMKLRLVRTAPKR